jgi:hypothetical protein
MTARSYRSIGPAGRKSARRLRLGLWTLVVLVASIGIGFGIVVQSRSSIRKALSVVRQEGGSYGFESLWPDQNRYNLTKANVKRLVSDCLGPEYVLHVTLVELSSSKYTDAVVVHLGSLPQLKFLQLSNSSITDVGLTRLNAL